MNQPVYIKPLHLICCNNVIPLVYDNSLSLYENICKFQYKLNEIIESQNNLQENFDNLLNWIRDNINSIVINELNLMLENGDLTVELNYNADTTSLNFVFGKKGD